MKNEFRMLFVLLIVFLFSCNSKNKNDLTNVSSAKETKSVEPIFLDDYPKEIDSIINIELDAHYNALNAEYSLIEMVVGHAVVHSTKSVGDSIVFDGDAVDYDHYDVIARTKRGDIIERWDFWINRDNNRVTKLGGPTKQ